MCRPCFNLPPNTPPLCVLRRYIDDPDFTPEKIASVSSACTSLCMWVHAMHTYDRVAKTIGPKREKLKGAEKELAKAQATLKEKEVCPCV